MRLNQLVAQLEQAMVFADFNTQVENISGQGQFLSFLHAPNVKAFVNVLEPTQLFNEELQAIKDSDLYSIYSNVVKLPISIGNDYKSKLENLKNRIIDLLLALKKVRGDKREDANSVYLRLPFLNDFDDLSKVSNTIQNIFGQIVYGGQINGTLKIESAESGSIWFLVALGNEIASRVVGKIVWAAALVYKQVQDGKIRKEQVKQQKLKTANLEKLSELLQFEVDLVIDIESERIFSEHFDQTEKDRLPAIKNSIKELAELISKGVEVQPALTAPVEVKGEYPDMKNLISLASKTKLLENPSAEDE
jgi:hypothetical protein